MLNDSASSRVAARIGQGGVLAFLALLALEHVLARDLDPARHRISEYATQGDALVMTVAFAGWAVSLAATARLATAVHPRPAGRVVAFLFGMAAAGVLLVMAFPTQAVAGELPPGTRVTTAGWLHDRGGEIVLVALVAAAALCASACGCGRWIRIASVGAALAPVGLALSGLDPGLSQRLAVVVACLWQVTLVSRLDRSCLR